MSRVASIGLGPPSSLMWQDIVSVEECGGMVNLPGQCASVADVRPVWRTAVLDCGAITSSCRDYSSPSNVSSRISPSYSTSALCGYQLNAAPSLFAHALASASSFRVQNPRALLMLSHPPCRSRLTNCRRTGRCGGGTGRHSRPKSSRRVAPKAHRRPRPEEQRSRVAGCAAAHRVRWPRSVHN